MLEKRPKISVIVPVYNVELYLKRCLDSIINQTLSDIEIICVNDGSTDNSVNILDEYAQKDDRIKIVSQVNAGLSAARNTGLKYVSGEYISFIDSDDWIDLDFYEKMYQSAVETNSDIAVCGIKRVYNGKESILWDFTEQKCSVNNEEKYLFTNCPNRNAVWHKIYKTKFLLDTNILFEEGRYYEDKFWTPQILYLANQVVTVPAVYYYYFRDNQLSIVKCTNKNKKMQQDRHLALNFALNFLKKNNINLDNFIEENRVYKFCGFRILKIAQKGNVKKYKLFGFIKWDVKKP